MSRDRGSPGPTDLFDVLARPGQLADPYPFYAWLRAHDPAHRGTDGTVYLSRFADAALLKDSDLRAAAADDDRSYTLRTINRSLIKAVLPRHTHLRRAAAVAFGRSLLARTKVRAEEIAARLAESLARALAADGVADLHAGYSLPFTQRVAAAVFGIPEPDFPLLAPLPSRMFGALPPQTDVADADDASRTLSGYLEEAVRERRFVPGSGFDLLASLQEVLPYDEVVRLCWMLWWGSYTSALAALDLAVLTLVEHPSTAPLLLDSPKTWIEEALRYRSPHIVNSANLTTRRTITVAGTTLAPHTPVRFLLAAMNRDEAVFPRPGTFVPNRTGTPHHIAFGEGIHSCIGAQLARMELSVALTALTTRLPHLALAGPPTWRTHTTQRLCDSLPVTSG
ncbi:cytochrome P450 [Streptomyces acidiscabies]|uniref:cytochrome P450 n=1 Tax=Streptomyces acidiscabies TaxID=42234 RepID=UPI001F4601BB|nr:cytochrome P450 [Streptomyces acidiscabies]